jgi:hypothetical protein
MSPDLEVIARGEMATERARSIIDSELTRHGPEAVYTALLRWTWCAISSRRSEDELQVFHGLLRDTADRVRCHCAKDQTKDGYDLRLAGLADMLHISVGLQERPSGAELLSRAHVGPILSYIKRSPWRVVGQSSIAASLGLKPKTVTRILTLLEQDGLIVREPWGAVRLTPAGMECRAVGETAN